MACTSGCPTQDCESYAACLRGKAPRVAYCGQGGGDATAQKKWDSELDAYKDARRQGIQPASTKRYDVENAVRISNESGTAFQA